MEEGFDISKILHKTPRIEKPTKCPFEFKLPKEIVQYIHQEFSFDQIDAFFRLRGYNDPEIKYFYDEFVSGFDDINFCRLRKKFYENISYYDPDAKQDPNVEIRKEYYERYGYDEQDAKKDSNYEIRLNYYKWTEWSDPDAKKDNDDRIRFLYYHHNYFYDKDALNDKSSSISHECGVYSFVRKYMSENKINDADRLEEYRNLSISIHPKIHSSPCVQFNDVGGKKDE